MGAVAAVDVILGDAVRVYCDTLLGGVHDRFDDLTVEWADGRWTRRQIKYQAQPTPLDIDTFVRGTRKLLLSEVFRSMRSDAALHSQRAGQSSYTVYLRDADAIDGVLTRVLLPADPDPGPSIVGTSTARYRFDAKALWQGVHREGAGRRRAGDAWEFLRQTGGEGDGSCVGQADDAERLTFTQDELQELCARLVVEVNAPAMSSDFSAPGALEQLLLARLREEVGVGQYPNENRRPEDVAAALVAVAGRARHTHEPLVRPALLRAIALRTDFGSVSRRSPVVPDQQVSRLAAVQNLRTAAASAAADGGFLVAEAPPGQGKSWVADQLRSSLTADDWTVAEHFCFLNDSEEERDDRVASERVFGSLAERIAAEYPAIAMAQRPIFSADEQTLMRLVEKVVGVSNGPVALIIDGLDHVTRVRASRPGAVSPSAAMASQIAALEPIKGCVIIVLSQPGDHLQPLREAGATTVQVPPMGRAEIATLLGRLGLNADELADDPEDVVDAVFGRSAGNPLYATYLCRELQREDRADLLLTSGSAGEVLSSIPAYDGDLEHYYRHLAALLDTAGQAAADTLTVVDFPLTVEELKAIQPGEGHRVAAAVRVLEPVLRQSPRGLAIYHESFGRYLRRELEAEPEALAARLGAVITWLRDLGLFRDTRAFRSLLPLLATAGRNQEVLALVDRSFAAVAVGAGFPPSAIAANLAVGVRCAQREGDWAAVARCLELMRGVETYEQERLSDLDTRFTEVRIALFGGEQVAERMLQEGLVTMPPEAGVLLCAELDREGFVAPWRPYLEAWRDEHSGNGQRGEDPEEHVVEAVLRGQFRLLQVEGAPVQMTQSRSETGTHMSAEQTAAATSESIRPSGVGQSPGDEFDGHPDIEQGKGEEPLPEDPHERLLTIARGWCDRTGTLSSHRIVVSTIADTLGLETGAQMAARVRDSGAYCLAVAEEMVQNGVDDLAPHGSVGRWATQAQAAGVPVGQVHRLRDLGAEQTAPSGDRTASDHTRGGWEADALSSAIDAATAALDRHSPIAVAAMLDAIEACRLRPVALDAIVAALSGEGWYRCWLRFCVNLVRAEAAPPEDASATAMAALEDLKFDARPFAGTPRAVDLYFEMDLIWDTIDRAVRLLDAEDWPRAIELLLEVGEGVTRSLRGEMGVPLPPDRTLTLALRTAPDEQLDFLSDLIDAEIERSDGRFYSDIAEFHLLKALCQVRLATVGELTSGDTYSNDYVRTDVLAVSRGASERAIASWTMASRMLLGYGFHKDLTIYEVLDPLRSLNLLDPDRGLKRMVTAQGLAYKARAHTDGKETRHAPTQWWRMLAATDPVAHAQFSTELGLNTRGRRTQAEHMRHDLWSEHADDADPVMAAVLAATLSDAPRMSTYGRMVQRLSVDGQGEGGILQRALTRGDEVAQAGTGDGSEFAEEAAALLQMNEVAAHHNLRQVTVVASVSDAETPTGYGPHDQGSELSGNSDVADMTSARQEQERERGRAELEVVTQLARTAPPGGHGVAALARAWRRGASRVGQQATRQALVEAYAVALIERLGPLIAAGQDAEVARTLESLSEIPGFNDEHLLLARIGELLSEAGGALEREEGTATAGGRTHIALAARAFALAWTQARGDGGWLAFGGRQHMTLLARATTLAPEVAAEAVGIGIERRLVGPGNQTMGITKALIEACAAQALTVPGAPSSADLAFNVWDEAAAVIADRLPALPGDEKLPAYGGIRLDPPLVDPRLSAVDYAFAVSSFAGLSHPGRENLRRTLIALDDLAHLRPRLFTHALPVALRSMTGAVLPHLLLSMVERVATEDPSILSAAGEELRSLLASQYLVVRALARKLLRLLPGEVPPLASSDLDAFPVPQQTGGAADKRLGLAASLLREAPYRASVIHSQLDGFIGAVVELIARSLDDDQFDIALRESVRDMSADRGWPDAILLSNHVAEESLQKAAGACRAVCELRGYPVTDPAEWEDDLAELLRLSTLPLTVERGRIPRPAALPLPSEGPHPENARSMEASSANGALVNLQRQPESAPWLPLALGDGGPYDAWVLVGYRETRRERRGHITGDDRQTEVQGGVELNLSALSIPNQRSPLALVGAEQWFNPSGRQTSETSTRYTPLAARGDKAFIDEDALLGLPGMLAPAPALVEALQLVAGDSADELLMCDNAGSALAHVTWRSKYAHSDYHMSYPLLAGSGLLLRPDLAQILTERWQDRLTWRTWNDVSAESVEQ
ncbi:hypothetical protein GCM10011509_10620 [Ornithinimicrobium pekingense]|uniref:Nephrocystin 3-like N-terminal domain-containing protein n=2 Tax=Ornithinimicrobium pekingense TaxID=384677 RepID=A0ABQ2F8N0_9MICO|nr:hypothetical protein GCM10011509_10620 [Ornithinimicrobium pekingense]